MAGNASEVRRGNGWNSYGRTPRALLRDPRVSMQAKALYGMISDYAGGNDYGMAWPGQERLAEHAGASVRSVKTWLAELVRHGWIVVHVETTDTGRRNIYEVMYAPRYPQGDGGGEAGCPMGSGSRLPDGVGKQAAPEVLEGAAAAAAEVEPGGARASSSSATSRARGAEPVDDDDDDQAQPQQPERVTASDLYADAGIDTQPTGGIPRLVEAVQIEQGWQPAALRRVATMASTKRDPVAWLVTVLFDLWERQAPDPNPLPDDLWSDLPDPDDEYWAKFTDIPTVEETERDLG